MYWWCYFIKEYQDLLYKVGFKKIEMINKNVDMNVWKQTGSESSDGDTGSSGCCMLHLYHQDPVL